MKFLERTIYDGSPHKRYVDIYGGGKIRAITESFQGLPYPEEVLEPFKTLESTILNEEEIYEYSNYSHICFARLQVFVSDGKISGRFLNKESSEPTRERIFVYNQDYRGTSIAIEPALSQGLVVESMEHLLMFFNVDIPMLQVRKLGGIKRIFPTNHEFDEEESYKIENTWYTSRTSYVPILNKPWLRKPMNRP